MTQLPDDTDALSALSNRLANAVEGVGRAVVQVDGRPRRPSSGVVYGPGLVLAADHAIERDDDLSVETADGPARAAQLVGRDAASDLAVLRIPGLGEEPARPSPTPARLGQFVLAVGRPAGRELMASIGIVSAVGGPDQHARWAARAVHPDRRDALPRFLGGALIDARGVVLGILTTGLAAGVALAVPAVLAWRLADLLASQGYVARGWLGVGSQPVRIPAAQRAGGEHEEGLLIVEVAPESPAERGGLLLGDILVALDGRAVADAEDLQALLTGDRVGRTVSLEVLRGGTPATFAVTVGQRPGRAR